MFFLTRRRARPLLFFGCGIPASLLRLRRLAPAGNAHALGPLAGPRVGLRPLAVNREPAPVAKAAVGADLREPLDVLRAVMAKVTLDLASLDRLAELHDLVVGQILDVGVGIHAGLAEDLARRRLTDAVDVSEPDLDPLVGWDVDASDSSHQP